MLIGSHARPGGRRLAGALLAAALTLAAVTARAVAFRQPDFQITFDRPFTWAVEHAPSGTLLFVGRVLNPTERSD